MKQITIFIIYILALSSCSNGKKETKSAQQTTSIEVNDDTTAIHQQFVTDSIKGLYKGIYVGDTALLIKTIVKNLIIVDNHLTFAMTKDSFVSKGLSEHYYDRLMNDLKSANQMIDSTDIENMDEILKESYRDLYQRFGEPDRKP